MSASRQKLIDRARNVPGFDPLRHVNVLTNYLVNSVFASFAEEIDGISADHSGARFAGNLQWFHDAKKCGRVAWRADNRI